MANMDRIRDTLGDSVCRRCINAAYHIDLQQKDCYYELYPHVCSKCGQVQNIVHGLRLSGKLKLAFK